MNNIQGHCVKEDGWGYHHISTMTLLLPGTFYYCISCGFRIKDKLSKQIQAGVKH
jgi:hypothetical protein